MRHKQEGDEREISTNITTFEIACRMIMASSAECSKRRYCQVQSHHTQSHLSITLAVSVWLSW